MAGRSCELICETACVYQLFDAVWRGEKEENGEREQCSVPAMRCIEQEQRKAEHKGGSGRRRKGRWRMPLRAGK